MEKNYAYISITGTGNTSEVTEFLGLEPTSSWNVGDLQKNASPYKFARWDFKVEAFEKDILQDALKSSRGNRARAARILQTTERILNYKIRKYGLEPERFKAT